MKKRRTEKITCARIPTASGEFQLCYYRTTGDDKEHLALVYGDVRDRSDVLVRIHSECFTGDSLGSLRCDCGPQLQQALQLIASEGSGVVVYLRQEGRGIGLLDKLRAYNLQDQGYDTVDANLMLGHQADARDYTVAALILGDLGVRSLRLLTNNPDKIDKLQALAVNVSERVNLPAAVTTENAGYLRTKVERMRHLLELDPAPAQTAVIPDILPPVLRRDGRPFVTLSFAQSLDGSITSKPGVFTAISGPESLAFTHQLRARHEAILIGVGTALADDPRLSVRLVEGSQPRPIIVDSRLRLSPEARLFDHPQSPWIFTTPQADERRQAILEERGATVQRVGATPAGKVSLTALLARLEQQGIGSLMVEGGAQMITSFLAAQLADHLIVTIAPKLLGGLNAIGFMNGYGLPHLEQPRYHLLGDDMVLSGVLTW